MATPSKRSVSLVVEADVTGEEGIRKLATTVRSLAAEGGEAAADFARLATEIDKAADQAGAVASIKSLESAVAGLSEKQRLAVAAAEALGIKLAEASAAAAPLVARQQQLAESTAAARVAQTEAANGLSRLKEEYVGAARDTGLFTTKQAEFNESIRLSRQVIADNALALAQLKPALAAATAEQSKLSGQYEALKTRAGAAGVAVREQAGALESARAAALAAGVATDDLIASENALLASTQRARGEVLALAQARERAADAAGVLADLDAQATEVQARLLASLQRTAQAYEADAIAAQQAAAAVERKVQADFDAAEAGGRLAAAQERGRAAAQSELAALRETELFLERYEAALKSATAARVASIAATATSARQAGAAIEQAFGSVGIRSIDAIQTEIDQTTRSLARLTAEANRTEVGLDGVRRNVGTVGLDELGRAAGAAEVKIARLRAEIQQVQATPGQFKQLTDGLNNAITQFAGLGAAIATVGIAVRPVIDATVALDQMRRILTTVTGSADVAQKSIEFLRQTAQQSGQSFTEIGASYAKFAASALQSGLSLKQTQDVFKAVSLAAGNLGLSSDQAKRALEALSQIASKGVVSMEELRQQLGDALPGVLPLLAKELGLTQAELNKVVESGQLLAAEAIPAIGRSLKALEPAGGIVNGLVATFNRFINVVKEAGTSIVEGPLGQAAGPVLVGLAQAIGVLATIGISASESMKLLGVSTLATFDALRGNITFKEAGDAIASFAEQSGARIAAFQARVDAIAGSSDNAGAALATLGRTAGFTGESFAKLTLEQQKQIDAATLTAQSAEKHVQAMKAEADAITRIAGLLGDEAALRQASADAAELQSKAVAEQLAADEALVSALQRQKQAVLDNVAAGKLSLESVKALLEETDKKIAKADADVDKTRAQADAARSLAAQTRLAVEATGDQSKRLDELREAVTAASAAQVLAARRFAESKGSLESLKIATEQLAQAKGLLRDAIDDLDKALKRQLDTLKADLTIKRASLALDLEQARNAQRRAIELGNETAARLAGIRIAQIEQTLQKTNISNKLEEAEATLKFVAAKEAELKAIGQLTPEKLQELELLRKGAIAQTLEAAATRESIKAADEQLARLALGLPARDAHTASVERGTTAVGGNTGSLSGNSGALRDNAKATDVASDARKRYNDLLEATRGLDGGVSGTGLAGIGPSQDGKNFGVRSPTGIGTPFDGASADSFNALYNRTPDGGITRTGSGQLQPPDNSGDWFFDTSRKGEGPFGLGVWRRKSAVAGGADSVSATGFAPFVGGFPGGVQTGFPGAPSAPTSAPAPAGGNFNVQVVIGGKSIGIAAKDMASINAMIEALEAAYRAGGGGG